MSGSELIGGAIGFALFGLGLAAVLAWTLHRRRPDPTLVFFGTWCSLYGLRLIAGQPVIVSTLGVSEVVAQYFRTFVTYAINVPVGLFIEALIGPGWNRSVRRVWQLLAGFAVIGIATDLVLQRPEAIMPLNSMMVLLALVVAIPNLWMYRGNLSAIFRSYVIGVPAAIMLLFVANENLRRPILPDINIEPVGVFIFVMALGYGVIARAFTQEAELVAVQRELDTARRIQASLLPREVPRVQGIELAAHYLPMSAVAGDLYDFVVLGPARVGILVADVSGHGVPAALVASMVKLAFTTQREHADDPSRVISAMNRAISHNVEGTFVTAVYAVVDAERRTITVANAGHPSVLVARAGGAVATAIERGFMMGLAPDAAYVNERMTLHRGDRVLLYTDGLSEAQSSSGDFVDEQRVAEWLGADAPAARALAKSLLDRLARWRGVPTYDDDVTFVVARIQ